MKSVVVSSIALIVTAAKAAPMRKRNLSPQHKSLKAPGRIQSDEAYDPYMGLKKDRKLAGHFSPFLVKVSSDAGSMPPAATRKSKSTKSMSMSMSLSMKPSEPVPSPPDVGTTEGAPSRYVQTGRGSGDSFYSFRCQQAGRRQ